MGDNPGARTSLDLDWFRSLPEHRRQELDEWLGASDLKRWRIFEILGVEGPSDVDDDRWMFRVRYYRQRRGRLVLHPDGDRAWAVTAWLCSAPGIDPPPWLMLELEAHGD